MAQQAIQRNWYRSREACVGGVCAGLAKRLDFDPVTLRILAVFIAIMTAGIGCIAYAVLWARTPLEPERPCPYDVTPERAESSAYGSVDVADAANLCMGQGSVAKLPVVPRLAVAVCLMMLFLFVSMNVAPIVPGTYWWQFWPLGLLIAGLFLIVIPIRSRFETLWHVAGIIVMSLAALALPISLNVVDWATVPLAFSQLWPIVALGAALVALGLAKDNDALMVIGGLLIALFCLAALMAYSVPGSLDTLLIEMPDGRSMRIAFVESMG